MKGTKGIYHRPREYSHYKRILRKKWKVITAWGNHPSGLYEEYEELKKLMKQILTNNKNQVFYVDRMTNAGNPKHGKVWGYKNDLIKVVDSN